MIDLIVLTVTFLILALLAYVLGAGGFAGFSSMEIAKWFVIIFVVLAILTFFFRLTLFRS